MEARLMQSDIRSLLVILLGAFPESDERHVLAQQIARRNGMVELLDDRTGKYEGGDG